MDINTKLPQVVSSCSGRFHVFDQARELQAANMLQQLICDYPASYVENFGISADRVKTLYKMAAFRLLWRSVSSYFPSSLYDSINRYFHHCFSMNLAKALPKEMDFFIGLSSFCQEALQACRERDILCAVDHGSLHQKEDALLVRAEAERWQLPVPKDTSPTWIIEKEDLEFNMADYVFVLSTVARDSLVRQGVDAKKIFVNPCGVDLNAFTPSLNKPPQFQIIQVGNISLRKGVPDLINAFAKARLPDAELTFVGSGCNDPDMQKLLKTLSLTRVRFIPPVPQADLTQYYQQASVFVLASIADGFGMVVSQAMA
ncbi:MAG TPA: glycosyltransferase, partial [Coxiellaceae bacterium]|nr:glycosyltransferase [Coxiellaceae bacterium]